MARDRRCPICGTGEIRNEACANRRVPFRNVPDLELPADLPVPTCSHCREELIDRPTAKRMDDALTAAYQRALAAKAEAAIEKLSEVIPQRDLEPLLGLSAGYLSKVKNDRSPSSPLVAVLMILAKDLNRVRELRDMWKTSVAFEEHGARVIQLDLSAKLMGASVQGWGQLKLPSRDRSFDSEALAG